MRADLLPTDHRARLRRICKIYRIFGPYLKRYWVRVLLAYATLLGTVLMALFKPWPMKLIFDYILLNKPIPEKVAYLSFVFGSDKFTLLTVFCIGMVITVFLNGLFSYNHRYLLSVVGQGMNNDVREGIF